MCMGGSIAAMVSVANEKDYFLMAVKPSGSNHQPCNFRKVMVSSKRFLLYINDLEMLAENTFSPTFR